MEYYVIADDGQRYGPANVDQLNAWILDNRLAPHQLVENALTGERMAARLVPGLTFSMQGGFPGAGMSPPGPMESNYVRPGAMPYDGTPAELRGGFNFGAFWFTWIWGLNHKKPITLVALAVGFIPFVGGLAALGIAIWIGMKGNEWAWESGRFHSVQECQACQRIWRNWAIGALVLAVTCGVLVFALQLASVFFAGS